MGGALGCACEILLPVVAQKAKPACGVRRVSGGGGSERAADLYSSRPRPPAEVDPDRLAL